MKIVADILRIAPRTVAFHKYRVMQDLGLKSNAELIQFAIKESTYNPINKTEIKYASLPSISA